MFSQTLDKHVEQLKTYTCSIPAISSVTVKLWMHKENKRPMTNRNRRIKCGSHPADIEIEYRSLYQSLWVRSHHHYQIFVWIRKIWNFTPDFHNNVLNRRYLDVTFLLCIYIRVTLHRIYCKRNFILSVSDDILCVCGYICTLVNIRGIYGNQDIQISAYNYKISSYTHPHK